ncbi:MAG: class I SAM-dependent methyltransferase [Bacteroidetes bacterium]|nr:class I SAM-dependent methyltransferase [Bacteroidota bacterium]
MTDISINTVADYYNKNQILYNLLWSSDVLHYGFWETGIKNHKEALQNTNSFVASCLDLKQGEIVLDAGCGVGGAAIYMAKQFGVKVNGITISHVQVKQALKSLEKNNAIKHLLNFEKRNYTDTGYGSESFEKIYAIESSCQASSKKKFAEEMYRLMKPDGKLVVNDFFLSEIKNEYDKKNLNSFLQGWAIPHLSRREDFYEILSKTGFRNIQVYDKTNDIKKSSRIAWMLGVVFYPFSWVGSALKIIPENMHPHCVACINQKYLFLNRVANYLVFVAEK